MFDFNTILDNVQDNINQSSLKITFDHIFRYCLAGCNMSIISADSNTYPISDYEHHILWENPNVVYFCRLTKTDLAIDDVLEYVYRYKFIFNDSFSYVDIISNKSIYDNLPYIIDEPIYRFIEYSPIPINSYIINPLKSFTSEAPVIYLNNYIVPFNKYENHVSFYNKKPVLNNNNVYSFLTYCNEHKISENFINNFPNELSKIGLGFNYNDKVPNYFLFRNMFENDEDFLKILNVYTKYGYTMTDEYGEVYKRFETITKLPYNVDVKNDELKIEYSKLISNNIIQLDSNDIEKLNIIFKIYNKFSKINIGQSNNNSFNNDTIISIAKENMYNYTYLHYVYVYNNFYKEDAYNFAEFLCTLVLMLVQYQIKKGNVIPIRYLKTYEQFALGEKYTNNFNYTKITFNTAFDIFLKHPNELCVFFNYVKNAMIFLNDDTLLKNIISLSTIKENNIKYSMFFYLINDYITNNNIPDYDNKLFDSTKLNTIVKNMINLVYTKIQKEHLAGDK